MEQRQFGRSGLRVPVLSFGTATFGGQDHFASWGQITDAEAKRLVSLCLDAGVCFFDTADIYSQGHAEAILGAALKGRREEALISSKGGFQMGCASNGRGNSRYHLVQACEASLRRLQTDYIDIYFVHGFDADTPFEETAYALDTLVRSGKVRYLGCSNFSAWQVVQALNYTERAHFAPYVAYQGYYSLLGRDYEWELMPMAQAMNIRLMVWSPLAYGRLTGQIRRGQPLPEGRFKNGGGQYGPDIPLERVYDVVDVLASIAAQTGKTVAQIAVNWLLAQPTVCNVVLGARNEVQLVELLGATGWCLSAEHQAQLAQISQVPRAQTPYPYWHQQNNIVPI